ncbi:MAG: hypothetical protein R3F54_10135 [Alphaproteobacteria bacterium]
MRGTIVVQYQYRDGYHIFTSEDVDGLYVASTNQETAYNSIAQSIETLIRHNEGISCSVEPALSFKEFVRAKDDQIAAHIMVSRNFILTKSTA